MTFQSLRLIIVRVTPWRVYCNLIITPTSQWGVSYHRRLDGLTVCSAADHSKHQSSASLAFVREIHRWPVNSHHKGSVTRRMFPFDYVIMYDHDCTVSTTSFINLVARLNATRLLRCSGFAAKADFNVTCSKWLCSGFITIFLHCSFHR